MLTLQNCSIYLRTIVLKQPIKRIFFFFFFAATPDHALDFSDGEDILSAALSDSEGLVMKLSTAEGADCG